MDKLLSNHDLKDLNSFGIKACAEYLYTFEINSEIIEFTKKIPQFYAYHILGLGNNILIKDSVIKGVVIQSQDKSIVTIDKTDTEIIVQVGAGVDWDWFVEHSLTQGWYGLENLSLIPGSVGAAPVQNIGAYGAEVEQFIVQVNAVNLQTGELASFSHAECQFNYRDSFFKHPENRNLIITSVCFKLWLQPKINLSYKSLSNEIQNGSQITPQIIRSTVINIRESKLPSPKDVGNAGSFFKNPIVSQKIATDLLAQYPTMPHWNIPNDCVKFAAAWFIEQTGFKGYVTTNGAGVHPNHALVLINKGGASGSDILTLANQIKATIKSQFGIELEPEINIW